MKLAWGIWIGYIAGLGSLLGYLVFLGTDSRLWGVLAGVGALVITVLLLWFYHWRLRKWFDETEDYW